MANAIERASDLLGGQASLARALNVSPPTVNQWISGIRPVSDEQKVAIEQVTKGAVPVEDHVSNTRWHRIADKTWPHPLGRPLIDPAKANAEAVKAEG